MIEAILEVCHCTPFESGQVIALILFGFSLGLAGGYIIGGKMDKDNVGVAEETLLKA